MLISDSLGEILMLLAYMGLCDVAVCVKKRAVVLVVALHAFITLEFCCCLVASHVIVLVMHCIFRDYSSTIAHSFSGTTLI
jgi:hypothetical protein